MTRARSLTLLLTLLFRLSFSAHAEQPADYQITAAKGPFFLCDSRVVEDRWLVERFVNPLRRAPNQPLITKKYDWEGS
ncbi:MAG: hypothetical protein U0903_12575, partial [Planctomycetales bacterium]